MFRSFGLALSAMGLTLLPLFATGCGGGCFFRLQTREGSQCLLDTCPNGSQYNEARASCECSNGYVLYDGSCVTVAQANATCGVGYLFQNGGCVARTCAAGQILNTQSGNCENRKAVDQAVAQNAGVELKAGQQIGCSPGFTYIANGTDGACVPNELTCGSGTRWEGNRCVAITCPPGSVLDGASGQCQKISTGDDKTFSVHAKLQASLGPSFCAPLAKNPTAFKVLPGQTKTIKVFVTLNIPGNEIEKTQVTSIRTIDSGGIELNEPTYSGVTTVKKQVMEQVLPNIRALGGKSVESQTTGEATCVIKRAPIQVIESQGGGV